MAGHLDHFTIDPQRAAGFFHDVGVSQQRRAKYTQSLTSLHAALTIFEAIDPPNHPNIAITLTNIGLTQQLLGDYTDSLATLKRALTIKEATYPPDHPSIAITLTNIGSTQQRLGDYKDSLATLQRALTINEATYPPDHPTRRWVLPMLVRVMAISGWSGG
ncbi:MAG: tetratricopeptide repeat protein [Actinomycetota bacterium]